MRQPMRRSAVKGGLVPTVMLVSTNNEEVPNSSVNNYIKMFNMDNLVGVLQ